MVLCVSCGNSLSINASRCPACATCVPMPTRRPGESADELWGRLENWLADAEHEDDDWLRSEYFINPQLRATFQRHRFHRGREQGAVLRHFLDRARRQQAFVAVARADPRASEEDRTQALKVDVFWGMMAGEDWLQQLPDDLAYARLTYTKLEEASRDGEVSPADARRAIAAAAAQRASIRSQ